MRAKVTKAFFGVEDGKVYPREIAEGEIISGDLAREAVAAKKAKAVDEGKLAAEARAAAAAAEKEAAQKRLLGLKAIAAGANVDLCGAESEDAIVAALKTAGVEVPAA